MIEVKLVHLDVLKLFLGNISSKHYSNHIDLDYKNYDIVEIFKPLKCTDITHY